MKVENVSQLKKIHHWGRVERREGGRDVVRPTGRVDNLGARHYHFQETSFQWRKGTSH